MWNFTKIETIITKDCSFTLNLSLTEIIEGGVFLLHSPNRKKQAVKAAADDFNKYSRFSPDSSDSNLKPKATIKCCGG